MNKKNDVLWIGGSMQCSIINGMAWHCNKSGSTLDELLKTNCRLIKGDVGSWSIDSTGLIFEDNPITKKYITKGVSSVIIFHKNNTETEIEKLKTIYNYLIQIKPKLKILNNPHKSNIISSKIEFSKHVSTLDSAQELIPAWYVFNSENILNEAIKKFGYPIIVKPDALSGGKGVVMVKDKKKGAEILHDSFIGKHYETRWVKIKNKVKLLLGNKNHDYSSREPFDLIINEYVNTYSSKYNCYINSTLYYWMGSLYFADVRVSNKGFNIHVSDSTNRKLNNDQFSNIIEGVMKLIIKYSEKIKLIVDSLEQSSVRVDCLIDLDKEILKVSEVEIKGGPGPNVYKKILPSMIDAGWDLNRIRKYLGASSCEINHLTDM